MRSGRMPCGFNRSTRNESGADKHLFARTRFARARGRGRRPRRSGRFQEDQRTATTQPTGGFFRAAQPAVPAGGRESWLRSAECLCSRGLPGNDPLRRGRRPRPRARANRVRARDGLSAAALILVLRFESRRAFSGTHSSKLRGRHDRTHSGNPARSKSRANPTSFSLHSTASSVLSSAISFSHCSTRWRRRARVYSSRPAEIPVSGRKTRWVTRRWVSSCSKVANPISAVQGGHSLGLLRPCADRKHGVGSVINIPVVYDGTSLAP